eukprot:TRINITY_DN32124_c0_g1_i1.p1 TRINITY_DN32124_c0_g1~~TRINITY_DN32124_c0_g1_i1.p1  ORF type:complete len:271 (-),score=43.28 TRINITY_DN32124_c0_g1_i1:267-1079(-)
MQPGAAVIPPSGAFFPPQSWSPPCVGGFEAGGAVPSGAYSPLPGGAPTPYPAGLAPPSNAGNPPSSFLSLFGDSQLSMQEIADRAHELQQRIDENAEREKASLRAAAEQKHLEIERHAAELARHAASSIEAYKSAQLQTAERQKTYQQAVIRQQADQAKRMIDQQAAQACSAVEARERQVDIQRQQQELHQRGAVPPAFTSGLPFGAPQSPPGPCAGVDRGMPLGGNPCAGWPGAGPGLGPGVGPGMGPPRPLPVGGPGYGGAMGPTSVF